MTTERIIVEIDANTAKLDAALNKTEKEVKDVDNAVKRADKSLDHFNRTANTTAKTTTRTSASVTKLGSAFKVQKGAAQQLGFQLQDVAVQAQAGTNAFQILGQQGSQLAGVMGPGGALLGAVIAIGAALAGVLFNALGDTSSKVEDLTDKLKKLIETTTITKEQAAVLIKVEKDEIKTKREKIATINEEIEVQRSTIALQLHAIERNQENEKVLNNLNKANKSSNEAMVKLIATRQLLNAGIERNTDNIAIFTAATGESTGQTLKQQEALDDLIATVKLQAEIFGFSSSALLERELRINGATEAQIEETVAIFESIEAKKEQLKLDKELEKQGDLLIERLKTSTQVLTEKLLADKELLDQVVTDEEERKALLLALEQKFIEDINTIKAKNDAKLQKDKNKQNKQDIKDAKFKAKDEENTQNLLLNATEAINTQFLNDNKAVKAGLVVADTARAVMLQLSSGDPFTAFSRAAAAGLIGVAQLANALSSTRGGGTISTGSSAPTFSESEEPVETSTLELSDRGSESQDVVITFEVGDGDEIMEVIANRLNDRNNRT